MDKETIQGTIAELWLMYYVLEREYHIGVNIRNTAQKALKQARTIRGKQQRIAYINLLRSNIKDAIVILRTKRKVLNSIRRQIAALNK